MTDLNTRIRLYSGSSHIEPEPEAHIAHPVLLLALLIATGWAAAIGAAYAAYRALEALAG